MTAQIHDYCLFQGEEYAIIGLEGRGLATPEHFGIQLQPLAICTGCRRGFHAAYELTDEGLYLRELTLRGGNEGCKAIDGVLPKKTKYQDTYDNLSIPISFTGKIRLAKDFIPELYVHMGFQKATAYKRVYDLTLKESRVIELKDRSQEMERKRGQFKKRYDSDRTRKTVDEAFSLSMDLE